MLSGPTVGQLDVLELNNVARLAARRGSGMAVGIRVDECPPGVVAIPMRIVGHEVSPCNSECLADEMGALAATHFGMQVRFAEVKYLVVDRRRLRGGGGDQGRRQRRHGEVKSTEEGRHFARLKGLQTQTNGGTRAYP